MGLHCQKFMEVLQVLYLINPLPYLLCLPILWGGKTYDGVYASLMSTGTSPSNYHTDIMKSWKSAPEG